MEVTLVELARLLAGSVEGDGQTVVTGIAALEQAQAGDLTFLTSRRHAPRLTGSQATAVLVDPVLSVDRPAVRVADPVLGLITLLEHFFPVRHPVWGIDPQAVLSPGVEVGAPANIGPYVVIGPGTRLGSGVTVYPGTCIGRDCEIGDGCVLYANVSIYSGVSLGRGVTIHSGAVIGADGFGFHPLVDGSYRKIPQIGRVVIGDGVEIGANTCIDRATMGETVIEAGAKLDNLVQIGHNTAIGAHTVLAGQVGVAGSVRIGRGVRMGGQAGVADHVTIGERAAIGGQTGVLSDVDPGVTVLGAPALPSSTFKRMHYYSLRLGELFQQVKKLQRRVELLEGRERNR